MVHLSCAFAKRRRRLQLNSVAGRQLSSRKSELSRKATLVCTTIERPDSAIEFLRSARQCCPDLPIILGEQCFEPHLIELCAEHGVTHVVLPYDCGISAARNTLVELCTTQYFVLADDDFVFTRSPEFEFAIRFLDSNADFVCLCGDLINLKKIDGAFRESNRYGANMLVLDSTARGVIKVPTDLVMPEKIEFENEAILICDMPPVFGVYRTSFITKNGMCWDERFKIGGEHMDFFLRIKLEHPLAKVGYWAGLLCEHRQVREGRYLALRMRKDWMGVISDKYKLRYYMTVGGRPSFF